MMTMNRSGITASLMRSRFIDKPLMWKNLAACQGLDFSLDPASPFPEVFPSDIAVSLDILKKDFVKLGELTQFEDGRMVQSYGVKGYWEPMTFLEEIGVSFFVFS